MVRAGLRSVEAPAKASPKASAGRLVAMPLLLIVLVLLLLLLLLVLGPSATAGARSREGGGRSAADTGSQPDFNGDGFADLAVGVPGEDIRNRKDAGAVNVIYGSADGLAAGGSRLWSQDSPDIRDRAEGGDHFGASLATADFDGDGFTDLAVGVRDEDLGHALAGAVNVIRGSPTGLNAAGNQFWSQDSRGILDRSERGDGFGWALTAGDFDGDGFADLAVGMRLEDVTWRDDGAVNVIYGSARGLTAAGDQFWSQASPGLRGRARPQEQMGWALAAGDFDGDGFDDLAVGAAYDNFHSHRAGGVHIIHGSARGLRAADDQFWGQDSPGIREHAELRDQFGQSLDAGDFDGDGFDDLAVGVWFEDYCHICNQGGVHAIYGSRRGLTSRGNQFWNQDSPGILDHADPFDRFGHALAAGDFDGDGFDDLAVGAPRDGLHTSHPFSDQGGVNVIYGSGQGLRSAGDQFWTQDSRGIRDRAEPRDLFGLALGAADFDGDGSSDLAVGVRYEDRAAHHVGGVNVIYGSGRGLRAAGNQVWSQDSSGIRDRAQHGDLFGWVVSTHSAASGTPGHAQPDYWR